MGQERTGEYCESLQQPGMVGHRRRGIERLSRIRPASGEDLGLFGRRPHDRLDTRAHVSRTLTGSKEGPSCARAVQQLPGADPWAPRVSAPVAITSPARTGLASGLASTARTASIGPPSTSAPAPVATSLPSHCSVTFM